MGRPEVQDPRPGDLNVTTRPYRHEDAAAGLSGLATDASHLARRFLQRNGWRVTRTETVTRNGEDLQRFRLHRPLGEPDDPTP